MKFYMFGTWEIYEPNKDDAYDIFIGITAETGEEAAAKLRELVGERATFFELYDIC